MTVRDAAAVREGLEVLYIGLSFSGAKKKTEAVAALDRLVAEVERWQRESDDQMGQRLAAQLTLKAVCDVLNLPMVSLGNGWTEATPKILARIELIVDEADRGFAERDVARAEAGKLRAALEDFANPQHWGIDRSYDTPKCVWIGTYEQTPVEYARAVLAGSDAPPTLECPRCGGDTTEAELTYSGCAECQREAAEADAPSPLSEPSVWPAVWERAEVVLLDVLDPDDAVSALQVLQAAGFSLSAVAQPAERET